eukprot:symbB.v1.2.013970.t1/scaffold1001.1/size146904/1
MFGFDVIRLRLRSSWQIVTSQGGYHGIDLPDENDKTRYYSAAVTTKDRVSWSAEPAAFRVCVRAKLPLNSKGVWPAHWMLPQNGYS